MLSDAQKKALLATARHSIDNALSAKRGEPAPMVPGLVDDLSPCFVTLTTRSGRLRGCVGTLESHRSLYDNVREYARLAAFDDPRFSPITVHEIDQLVIGISVLGPTKPLHSVDDICLGKHGLSVTFREKRGVLLAKVATEFGWNREQFMDHVCEKAHLNPENRALYQWRYFEEESFDERATAHASPR